MEILSENLIIWFIFRAVRLGKAVQVPCWAIQKREIKVNRYLLTLFISDPPENITLSAYKLTIKEGEKSAPVVCTADGHPLLVYMWTYEGEHVSDTNELRLDYPASRERSGDYLCTASNIHGEATATVSLDVQCEYSREVICKLVFFLYRQTPKLCRSGKI